MSSNHPTGQSRQSNFGTPQDQCDDKPNPAPPEQTNYAHPTAPGQVTSIPGEGLVSPETARTAARRADAPPHTRTKAPNDPDAPGPVEPSSSAGAAAQETSDPNFSAVTHSDRRRE
jgi:hypothetical protein